MPTNTKAAQQIAYHFTFETGPSRLFMILSGLKLEINIPGMRLTRKAPKCSTILRKEFGLSGQPRKLYDQFLALITEAGVMLPEGYEHPRPEAN